MKVHYRGPVWSEKVGGWVTIRLGWLLELLTELSSITWFHTSYGFFLSWKINVWFLEIEFYFQPLCKLGWTLSQKKSTSGSLIKTKWLGFPAGPAGTFLTYVLLRTFGLAWSFSNQQEMLHCRELFDVCTLELKKPLGTLDLFFNQHKMLECSSFKLISYDFYFPMEQILADISYLILHIRLEDNV